MRTLDVEMEKLIKEVQGIKPWFIKRFAGLLIIQAGVIAIIIALLR